MSRVGVMEGGGGMRVVTRQKLGNGSIRGFGSGGAGVRVHGCTSPSEVRGGVQRQSGVIPCSYRRDSDIKLNVGGSLACIAGWQCSRV